MITNQFLLFLIYLISGILIGIVFDFFRSLRKSIKTSNLFTYIEDILFWTITSFIIILTILKYNYGELRLYIFLGIGAGLMVYLLTLSKLLIKLNVAIMNVFVLAFRKIKTLLLKILGRPIGFIIINLKKFSIKKKHK